MEMSTSLCFCRPYLTIHACSPALSEVVLYTLLDGFKFSPGKEIYWNMIGVATPSSQPEMKEFKSDCPLVVSRAD
jgi:hypothetical protein